METTKKQKYPLIGMTLSQLEEVVKNGGMPKFVAKQLAQWIYEKRAESFDEMVNISKKNKEWLAEYYEIGRSKPVSSLKSKDGTKKYLFSVGDNKKIESVYIPDKDRATLCVSSQVGCRMNCYFCMTGKQGFHGNLTAAQIINQILSIPPRTEKGCEPLNELTNVVFMGMGEPLDNLTNLLTVIEILTAPWGLAWSPKRITVSTVGKLDGLKELLDKTQVQIAISVHSADALQRGSMMPVQKAYPISSVMRLLSGYDFSHQRRLSLEYIMWRNVNDDLAHADMLISLIDKLDCRVNLIRFHKIPDVDLVTSSDEKMIIFRNYLNSKGIISTIRTSRGEDIMAACGMLAGKGEKTIGK